MFNRDHRGRHGASAHRIQSRSRAFRFGWIGLLSIAVACALASSSSADNITWVNDGGDGWNAGESVAAADMDQIKTQVDDNNSELTTLQTIGATTADISDVSVTQTELAELQTIGATSISAADWTAVAAMSGVNTGDNTVATTGDSATSFFASGTIEDARIPSAITRDSEVSALTVSTADPTDGSDACTEGDMWLNHTGNTIFFCVDTAGDDWWGVNLSDTP